MNSLDIVIPTHNRKNKLLHCIASIAQAIKSFNVNIYIYASDTEELKEYSDLFKNDNNVIVDYHSYKKCSGFWNDHIKKMKADAIMTCNDDVLFNQDTIENIFKYYTKYFPNNDGIVGINQTNIIDHLDSAFTIIGTKYADKFPDRNVWCIDYHRFYGDKELGEYAKSINKFYYCNEIKITHLHPSTDIRQLDNTHNNVRKWLNIDRRIYEVRKMRKLLYGKEFVLITKGTNNE